MADAKFQYTNIAYNLFEDVIQWFTCEDVRAMTYNNDTRLFWSTGLRLFKNKFLEFMQGPTFKGIRCGNGNLQPELSWLNFVVPAR